MEQRLFCLFSGGNTVPAGMPTPRRDADTTRAVHGRPRSDAWLMQRVTFRMSLSFRFRIMALRPCSGGTIS